MVCHPCAGDNHQSMGGWSERTQGQANMARETHSVTYVPCRALHSFRYFAQFSPSLFYCPRPPSHHPSSITSVSLVPAFHLLPQSIPFWPYGTHPFFPHAQTISILSDLLYSLTPFIFPLSYAPFHS